LCQRALRFQAKTNGQRENEGNKSFHNRKINWFEKAKIAINSECRMMNAEL
jgi:hypothetical protein